jgi:predicted  nucleic acid-binding Zn-ribbon protein
MSEQIHGVPTMHDDHRSWQSAHSMWQQDIDVWHKQLERGFQELEDVKQMMMNLQAVLRDHRCKIEERETSLKAHEQDMAKCEKLGLEYLENLTIMHLEINKQFEEARVDHDRLKRYQHNLMSKLDKLVKSMEEPD